MNCFKPVKIYLTDEERERRMHLDESYPLLYRMATFVYVPCGKCEACLSKRKSDWFVRLKKEHDMAESAYFITLTYDQDKVPWRFVNAGGQCLPVMVVEKEDCQNFLKRLRKAIQPFKVRYFLISEYGPRTLRPHYHLILFNFPELLKDKIIDYVDKAWGNGFVSISSVNDSRISYCVNYCLDNSTLPDYLPKNFMLCSRRPGIGSCLFDDGVLCDYIRNNKRHSTPVFSDGETKSFATPRYYKDKLLDRATLDAIASKGMQDHAEEVRRLRQSQRDWLTSHGYEVNSYTLNAPFDGSPVSLQHQVKEQFKLKVQNKNKMNKKKL